MIDTTGWSSLMNSNNINVIPYSCLVSLQMPFHLPLQLRTWAARYIRLKRGSSTIPASPGKGLNLQYIQTINFYQYPQVIKKFGGSGISLIILTQLPDTFGTVSNTVAVIAQKKPGFITRAFFIPPMPLQKPYIVFKNYVPYLCSDSSRDSFQNKSWFWC